MAPDFIAFNVENVEVSATHVTCLLSAHTLSSHGIYTESVVPPLEELLSAWNQKNPPAHVGAEEENGELRRT